MPNMADIVVKKKDGTTDVTYAALTPSAGDKTPARWSLTASATQANLRPTLEMTSRFNASRNARNVHVVLKYPNVVTVEGVNSVRAVPHATADFIIPLQADDAAVGEMVAQFANLLKSALMQTSVAIGYAPQ